MNGCYMRLRSCSLRKRIVTVKSGPCGKFMAGVLLIGSKEHLFSIGCCLLNHDDLSKKKSVVMSDKHIALYIAYCSNGIQVYFSEDLFNATT